MTPDVDTILTGTTAGVWVRLDVLIAALELGTKRRAYQVIEAEGIRFTPTRPREYNLDDIARVWRARKDQP